MPFYVFTVGDHEGRPLWVAPQIEAPDYHAGVDLLLEQHPQAGDGNLIVTGAECQGDDDRKTCGCLAGGLSRVTSLWECRACDLLQSARHRRCAGCGIEKGLNPRGFGCCATDWSANASHCGDLPNAASEPPPHLLRGKRRIPWAPCYRAFCADDLARLPHPDVTSFTCDEQRDAFTNRRGVRCCVGCHKAEA